MDKKAIGLSRVQQFSHLFVAPPYQIFVNSIFKHIHTTSISTSLRSSQDSLSKLGVRVGLRQGRALCAMLFIMMMNLISANVPEQEELKNIQHADDVTVVADIGRVYVARTE